MFPSFCMIIPYKPLFILVEKLHESIILKSYFIVSSNITGNAHKMISHYVTDFGNVIGRRNITRGCIIMPVSKNFTYVLLHRVMLHGLGTLANDVILWVFVWSCTCLA